MIEKQKRHISLTVSLLLIHLFCYSCQSIRDDINDYISSLSYNKDEILAYKGQTVNSSYTDGKLDDDKNFIVLMRDKKKVSNEKYDLSVITADEHKTYPGSLLLANSRLVDNSPDIVAVERAPLVYTVDLPGLTSDGSFSIEPSFTNYEAARTKVLNSWFQKYEQSINSTFQQESCLAYSKEQLRVKFGTEFKDTDVELNTDFSAIDKHEKLVLILKFTRIFYTVAVDSPKYPAELFGSGVTRQDLAGKFNAENPPVMVDSVSYGRIIYLKIETSSTDKAAKSILENKLTKFNFSATGYLDDLKQLKNIDMQVYVMGGGSDRIEPVNVNTAEDVNNIIAKYGKIGRNNTGYPVSYNCYFIKDNSKVVVKSVTEYTEITKIVRQPGVIKLNHIGSGWFVSKWVVEWDEISYDQNGKEISKTKGWSKNEIEFTAPYSKVINLNGNAQNIRVCAKGHGEFLNWERVIFDGRGIPLINKREFSIWGILLSPQYSIEPPLKVQFN